MWTVAASTNSSYLRAVANGFRRSSYLQAWHAVRHLVRRSADSPGWLFIRARVYTKRGLTCANGDDLPGLAAQDAAVQDVAEELRSLHLGVTPFRYLAGARSMRDPFGVGLLPHRAGARPVSDRDPTAGAGGHRVHRAQQGLRPVRAGIRQRDAPAIRRDGRGHRLAIGAAEPANPLDFRTVTDVLLTLVYIALGDPKCRHQVI